MSLRFPWVSGRPDALEEYTTTYEAICVPNLRALCFCISGRMSNQVSVMRHIFQIIEAADKLERLMIAADDKYVLEKLDFCDPERTRNSLTHPIAPSSLTFDLLNPLTDFGDFSWERSITLEKLEELSLKNLTSIPMFSRPLSALRSLYLSRAINPREEEVSITVAVQHLILNCPRLMRLTLINFACIIKTDLTKYIGSKLKVFSTIDYSTSHVPTIGGKGLFLNQSDFRTLGAFCPSIKILGFVLYGIYTIPTIAKARSSMNLVRQESANGNAMCILNSVAAMFPDLKELYLFCPLYATCLTGDVAVNSFDVFDGLRALYKLPAIDRMQVTNGHEKWTSVRDHRSETPCLNCGD